MKIVLIAITLIFAVACTEGLPTVPEPSVKATLTPKPPLELIDISKVPPRDKSRFQEGHTADGRPNPIAEEIVANGKDSIPFLIGKLEDETEMDRHVMPFWYQLHVGDMALIILGDLFTDETGMKSTVPGFGWDDFLERGGDESLMGEEVLRRYLRKQGRKTIRQRWQHMWEENRDRIYWDQNCLCFKLRS